MDDFPVAETPLWAPFPDFPKGWVPAWRETPWGRALTFEVVQRLDARAAAGAPITQDLAAKEARDVVKCYGTKSHELYACLTDSDPYFREQAKRELSELNAWLRRYDSVKTTASSLF